MIGFVENTNQLVMLVTDIAFRTARFKQFTGNLRKCLEDLAKKQTGQGANGGNGMNVFSSKIAMAIGVLCWGLCYLGYMLV